MDQHLEADDSESTRQLTTKQLKFAAAYADPSGANGNATLASKMAGYKGDNNQLGVQGCANLKNERIRRTITQSLDAQGATVERAAVVLAEATLATKRKSFLDKHGKINYTELEADHNVRLHAAKVILRVQQTQPPDQAHGHSGHPDQLAHHEGPVIEATAGGELLATALPVERVVLRSNSSIA